MFHFYINEYETFLELCDEIIMLQLISSDVQRAIRIIITIMHDW